VVRELRKICRSTDDVDLFVHAIAAMAPEDQGFVVDRIAKFLRQEASSRDPSWNDVRLLVQAALRSAGAGSAPLLKGYLDSAQPDQRGWVIESLAKASEPQAKTLLREELADADALSSDAGRRLGNQGDYRVCDVAALALRAEDPGLSFDIDAARTTRDLQIKMMRSTLSRRSPSQTP
jgi:hypothetical protein